MHRLAIIGGGLLSIAGFVGGASAADLPARTYTKAPAMVAPVSNWGGFYVGLDGGVVEIVAHVGEEGSARFELVDEVDGLGEVGVAGVGFAT